MSVPKLSEFIRSNIEPILQAWDDFARTVEPPALTMDDKELRDHAHQMLIAIADDLDEAQTDQQRIAKSQGLGGRGKKDTPAETHAEARLLSGYSAVQLVSEYRALRSSVLALWSKEREEETSVHLAEMTRFNEAIDQALAESAARFEHLVKQSQNMFLAILGHDLRNPLSTVMSGSAYIMRAEGVAPHITDVAGRIQTSSKRMRNLVNDLIDFTRDHLGPGIPIRATEGNLVAVCEQIVGEFRTTHPDRQFLLDAPERIVCVFDFDRLSQLLSNLLGNAIQHGESIAPIAINVGTSSAGVKISVNNKGTPIPSEKIASVFEPLVRVVTNESVDKSSLGLGLFISRAIARAHGGDVIVSSDTKNGTTFTVVLPLKNNVPRDTY